MFFIYIIIPTRHIITTITKCPTWYVGFSGIFNSMCAGIFNYRFVANLLLSMHELRKSVNICWKFVGSPFYGPRCIFVLQSSLNIAEVISLTLMSLSLHNEPSYNAQRHDVHYLCPCLKPALSQTKLIFSSNIKDRKTYSVVSIDQRLCI